MTYLKSLGIALASVLAMGGILTSSAVAQQGSLTSDGPVQLIGEEAGGEPATMEAFGMKVVCPGSTATGYKYNVTPHEFVPSGSTTITVIPHIDEENCRAAGFPATVDTNGCDGVIHIGETTGEADHYGGSGDLVCPEGQEVVLTVFTTQAEDPSTPFCTVRGGSQSGLTGATALDRTDGTIEMHGPGAGIHVTRSNHGAHGLLCPKSSTENASAEFVGLVYGLNEEGGSTGIGLSHN